MTATHPELYPAAIALLRQLIAMPSFSREEQGTAGILQRHLQSQGIAPERLMHNVWARNRHFDPARPTLLLNSHHDTVQPNKGYTRDPFTPIEEDGRLYGLGSNDAGGCLISLLAAFLHFYERENLKYNLVFAASAEEEISGPHGIRALLPAMGAIAAAIVGEPTGMELAVAEKGLMVLDCPVPGKAGHAAREEGDNAIYNAMPYIDWFRQYRFPEISPLLGPVTMNVTMIRAGLQHNMVPDCCDFTVDIRINEHYTHEEVLDTIQQAIRCPVRPRSMHLRSTSIATDHPLVQAGLRLGKKPFGSGTLSDKALMPFPALKMGPGDSARSHTADEFIYLREIADGIDTYIQLLNQLL